MSRVATDISTSKARAMAKILRPMANRIVTMPEPAEGYAATRSCRSTPVIPVRSPLYESMEIVARRTTVTRSPCLARPRPERLLLIGLRLLAVHHHHFAAKTFRLVCFIEELRRQPGRLPATCPAV